ncbi:MAG: EamA family transporter RarD [Thermoguttaceae bacterium]|nr:EamA family transporter RarD [Thermoguttaceae bacterium]
MNESQTRQPETVAPNPAARPNDAQDMFGTTLGFLAFFIWGLFPIYFAFLREVPPLVTLAFRATFTTVLLAPMLLCLKRGPAIVKALRNPLYVAGLFVTMATTAASWGFFIWLVAINHTTYASLGNYACPLVTVAFAAIFFHERLRALQLVAIMLAACAVCVFAAGVGRLPWESVVVAFVFAIYSVLRKKMDVDSTTALSIETLFALPIAVGYIFYEAFAPNVPPSWSTDIRTLLLLIGGGALTAIPLLLFGAAAHRCRLMTLAILNYLTPTGQFVCGTFLLHEKTTIYQWLSFVVIWIALTFFTLDLFRHEKERGLEQKEKKATNSR